MVWICSYMYEKIGNLNFPQFCEEMPHKLHACAIGLNHYENDNKQDFSYGGGMISGVNIYDRSSYRISSVFG